MADELQDWEQERQYNIYRFRENSEGSSKTDKVYGEEPKVIPISSAKSSKYSPEEVDRFRQFFTEILQTMEKDRDKQL